MSSVADDVLRKDAEMWRNHADTAMDFIDSASCIEDGHWEQLEPVRAALAARGQP